MTGIICCVNPTSGTTPGSVANTTWVIWNSIGNQTQTIVTSDPTWGVWSSQAGTQANVIQATNQVWIYWCNGQVSVIQGSTLLPSVAQQHKPTAEELQAQEAAYAAECERHEQRRAEIQTEVAAQQTRMRENQAKNDAAKKRAWELLCSHLSEKQRETLDKNGWFLIEGGKSKKTYRIYANSYAGNIRELAEDKEVMRYCVHATGEFPLGDQLLTQAISLRFDEDYIIGKANKTKLAA